MQVATNYAKKKVLGNVSDRVHQNKPAYETDPEILAATQEIAAKKKHHWYNKKVQATPDLLLSKEERKILLKVKNRAWYLDKGFHCCCFNVGLDGLIGLIPGIGDVITTVMAMQLVRTASKANLPKAVIAQMMWNVMLDFMIGLTPIAGDILDIFFKCNWRNAMLLEEFLIMRRMDEIRLEKGQHAVMNADHTVTTTAGALDGGGGPSKPKQAATLNHHHENQVSPLPRPAASGESTPTDQAAAALVTTNPADTKKNKYGTFFKWK
ncbi:hypothetical protein FB192DRAFT_1433046 [Mucor lusitanicus]|uniref:DUF4112 domain-containing protein n=2 Tax=Mucor circinelloides f. lusitanicus TaxID=29924 RepID=A0A162QTM6_MUCCL|nr:hypothetical protein FB192DRAFT_1433046 [Mucor lusitanicus]OAD05580.1 hypothetical protein MUCCIDRAFT_162258 [Mucor lusitanicus CBS 277.49]